MNIFTISSLRWRLVLVMCLAYIIVALTTLTAGYNAQQSNLHHQLVLRARNDAGILAAGAVGQLIADPNGTLALQRFVASLHTAQGVTDATVINGNGIIVGATNPLELRRHVQLNVADLPTSARATTDSSGDINGEATIASGTVLGIARVTVSSASIRQDLQDLLLLELVVRALGLAIFVLLSLIIAQYILGPVDRMARAARAIRRGNMATRVPHVGGAELQTLAEAFNDMAAALEQRIKHLSFLGMAGSILPTTFRERGDIKPTLERFCNGLAAQAAALIPRDDSAQSDVQYSSNKDDGIWDARIKALVQHTQAPTTTVDEGRCIMTVPVLGEAVFVTVRYGEKPFSQEEQQVVMMFANQVAIASDNARLLDAQNEALQVKDQFLSIVSHELRTPLTTIKGYAQMLHRKLAGDPQTARFAENIDAQAARLSRLVDDLLDVTRFSRGQFELLPQQMDLRPLLEEVATRFRLITPRHTFQVKLDRGTFVGYWDRDRLEQVMNNLISNAIKYSPDGGTITIATRHEDSRLVIAVRDEGQGIPERDQTQLFERFFRGTAEHQDVKGLGLGLYVTRRIVEAHGGEVSVTSQMGEGSEFSFTLPLLRQPALQSSRR